MEETVIQLLEEVRSLMHSDTLRLHDTEGVSTLYDRIEHALTHAGENTFQSRVANWAVECFGEEIAKSHEERRNRMLEEALELFQSCGGTEAGAVQLSAYVFGRPVGELPQEVGGLMVTLAALCEAYKQDMASCGWIEQERCEAKTELIREKQKKKPKVVMQAIPEPNTIRAAKAVLAGWAEMQKFGSHEGECDFVGSCPECGTPQGVCSLHSAHMESRMAAMDEAIALLRASNNLCEHSSTTIDPRSWPTGEDIEICNDCGASRAHWEQGQSNWQFIPSLEDARFEVLAAMNAPIGEAILAFFHVVSRYTWAIVSRPEFYDTLVRDMKLHGFEVESSDEINAPFPDSFGCAIHYKVDQDTWLIRSFATEQLRTWSVTEHFDIEVRKL